LQQKDQDEEQPKKSDSKDKLLEQLKNNLSESELKTILDSSRFQVSHKKVFQVPLEKDSFKFIATSDTHIGHKKFREDWWDYMISVGLEEEVDWIYHVGDIVEGMSGRPGHVYELSEIGFEAQFGKARKLFEECPIQIKAITGNHDCLSEDTEVLTSNGWKFYEQLSVGDKILSLTKDGSYKWDSVNEVLVKDFSGDLLHFKNQHIDMLVTPNHRVLVQNRKIVKGEKYEWTDPTYQLAKDLIGRKRIPVSSFVNNVSGCGLNDDEIKLLGWLVTDGTIKNGNCVIYQSKDITGILEILDNLCVDYKVRVVDRDIKEICGKKLIKKCLPQNIITFKYDLPDKFPFPDVCFDFSSKQFDMFFDSVIKADGCKYKHTDNAWILYGTKEFLSNIQILCVLNGYRGVLVYDNRGCPRLNISRSKSAEFDVKTVKNEVPYTGKVWCLSVPETNFMVRRNGKPFFTGNCWLMQKGDVGVDVGARLEDSCSNFTHMGPQEADELVGGIKIKLWHGLDGASYATSYRSQKFVEQLTGGEKPHILLCGHAHKSIYHQIRNVSVFECGTLCEQTTFMRGKKLAAHTGFWVVTVDTDGESITRIKPEWFPLFK